MEEDLYKSKTKKPNQTLFTLGGIYASRKLLETVDQEEIIKFIIQHSYGLWNCGNVEKLERNILAIVERDIVMGGFETKKGQQIKIFTSWRPNRTIAFLSDELPNYILHDISTRELVNEYKQARHIYNPLSEI